MFPVRAGVVVKGDCGLFLEVFWLHGIAKFGLGIFPSDGEGEAGKEVVDDLRAVSAGCWYDVFHSKSLPVGMISAWRSLRLVRKSHII